MNRSHLKMDSVMKDENNICPQPVIEPIEVVSNILNSMVENIFTDNSSNKENSMIQDEAVLKEDPKLSNYKAKETPVAELVLIEEKCCAVGTDIKNEKQNIEKLSPGNRCEEKGDISCPMSIHLISKNASSPSHDSDGCSQDMLDLDYGSKRKSVLICSEEFCKRARKEYVQFGSPLAVYHEYVVSQTTCSQSTLSVSETDSEDSQELTDGLPCNDKHQNANIIIPCSEIQQNSNVQAQSNTHESEDTDCGIERDSGQISTENQQDSNVNSQSIQIPWAFTIDDIDCRTNHTERKSAQNVSDNEVERSLFPEEVGPINRSFIHQNDLICESLEKASTEPLVMGTESHGDKQSMEGVDISLTCNSEANVMAPYTQKQLAIKTVTNDATCSDNRQANAVGYNGETFTKITIEPSRTDDKINEMCGLLSKPSSIHQYSDESESTNSNVVLEVLNDIVSTVARSEISPSNVECHDKHILYDEMHMRSNDVCTANKKKTEESGTDSEYISKKHFENSNVSKPIFVNNISFEEKERLHCNPFTPDRKHLISTDVNEKKSSHFQEQTKLDGKKDNNIFLPDTDAEVNVSRCGSLEVKNTTNACDRLMEMQMSVIIADNNESNGDHRMVEAVSITETDNVGLSLEKDHTSYVSVSQPKLKQESSIEMLCPDVLHIAEELTGCSQPEQVTNVQQTLAVDLKQGVVDTEALSLSPEVMNSNEDIFTEEHPRIQCSPQNRTSFIERTKEHPNCLTEMVPIISAKGDVDCHVSLQDDLNVCQENEIKSMPHQVTFENSDEVLMEYTDHLSTKEECKDTSGRFVSNTVQISPVADDQIINNVSDNDENDSNKKRKTGSLHVDAPVSKKSKESNGMYRALSDADNRMLTTEKLSPEMPRNQMNPKCCQHYISLSVEDNANQSPKELKHLATEILDKMTEVELWDATSRSNAVSVSLSKVFNKHTPMEDEVITKQYNSSESEISISLKPTLHSDEEDVNDTLTDMSDNDAVQDNAELPKMYTSENQIAINGEEHQINKTNDCSDKLLKDNVVRNVSQNETSNSRLEMSEYPSNSPGFITATEYLSQGSSAGFSPGASTTTEMINDSQEQELIILSECLGSMPNDASETKHVFEITEDGITAQKVLKAPSSLSADTKEALLNVVSGKEHEDLEEQLDIDQIDEFVEKAVDQIVPDNLEDGMTQTEGDQTESLYLPADEGKQAEQQPGCFKWKYTPSCDLDFQPGLATLEEEEDHEMWVKPLRTCGKPIRVGLSRRQPVHKLHKMAKLHHV